MKDLQEKLNYTFQNHALLTNALTHSSYANENRACGMDSNERLEFLGDSVLGLTVADYLFRNYPELPEGKMTRVRAELVCEHTLHEVACALNLGNYIRLGKGEEHTGGRQRTSILADCVEAIVAAMYLDGGMEPARAFIYTYILSGLKEMPAGHNTDYKTELQELVQQENGRKLSYELVGSSGPDHRKTFTVQVSVDGKVLGKGEGHTKKEAEQTAAMYALEALKQ